MAAMEDGGLPVMSEDEPDVPDEAFDAEAAAVAAGEAEWQTVTPDEAQGQGQAPGCRGQGR